MTDTSLPRSAPQSAIVLGGGILGCSTAVHLARLGLTVTLVTEGPLAAGASGRSLAWLNSARKRSEPYHRLRMAGIERYRTLAAAHPGADWITFAGGLTWDPAGAGNRIAEVWAHERAIGYEALLLPPETAAARVPGVAAEAITPPGAILNPGEGWVDLPSLIARLAAEIGTLGGRILTLDGPATPRADGPGLGLPDGTTLRADALVIACGAATPALAGALGTPIGNGSPTGLVVETEPLDHPIRAVMNTPRVSLRPTPAGGLYMDSGWSEAEVIHHADGRIEIRPETVEGLLAEARRVLSPAPELTVRKIHTGPKPIPGDGEPVFGPLPSAPGVWAAFSHSGATLGLIAGELMADEIALGIEHPLLAAFRPARFAAPRQAAE
ncbi:NAD(P)/FAD-dependent oxidoreductase [Frigidibacter sp. MR17.24]|uniref:NAD(P)/FAD-dependent oxidoreductase n=1 Tax=Frigidibacter sp. MR17.24 TaxID=3127345 RepID=UPI003012FC23